MVGQNIGKYRVLDRIGRGGMGTVYRAMDETLHRDVAIKVLNAELNDPEVARRFRAEAITVARLSHPGIATIYELFQHDGQWLMVMEFVRGETLEHLVERMGAVSPQRSAELCMQTLAALAHAHSMGVVHRDLKPANLMITETGAIKVMDFGIARVAGTEHLTNVGFMMGTPAYMAPEQVMGQEIDARADLYAMGVVFYRLTTAKLPFKGETPFAMAQSQVNDPPTPVGIFRADLPSWVQQVVVRSLAKGVDERFQSAVEFHESLGRCLAGLPMFAVSSPSAPTELMKTPSRAMPTGSLPSAPFPGVGPASLPPPAGPSGNTPFVGPPTPLALPLDEAGDPTVLSATPGPLSSTSGRPSGAVVTPSPRRRLVGAVVAACAILAVVIAVWLFGRTRATPSGSAISQAGSGDLPASAVDVDLPAEVVPPPQATSEVPIAGAAAPAPIPSAPAPPVSGVTRGASSAAASRGVAPPAVTPPPAPPAGEATHRAFGDVRVLIVDGRRADDREILLSFLPTQLSLVAQQGGSAVAALPYAAMVRGTYVRARDPRWDPTLNSPPANLDVPGGVFRTSKHWLTLQAADSYLILRLGDKNWTEVLQALETRGVTITRVGSADAK